MSVTSFIARDRGAEAVAWTLWEALFDARELLKGTTIALVNVDVDVAQLPLLTVVGRLVDTMDAELARRRSFSAK